MATDSKVVWVVQLCFLKYFAVAVGQISFMESAVSPHKRATFSKPRAHRAAERFPAFLTRVSA